MLKFSFRVHSSCTLVLLTTSYKCVLKSKTMRLHIGLFLISAFYMVQILEVQAEEKSAGKPACRFKRGVDQGKAPSETPMILTCRDNSGHASQLTAMNLKIFPGGKLLDNPDRENSFVRIPRHCLKQESHQTNLFSLDLSASNACPFKLKLLVACRKYTFEIKSEYFNASHSAESSMLETFTSQRGINPTNLIEGLWSCLPQNFFCRGIIDQLDPYAAAFGATKTNGCVDNDKICNRETDCESGIDELHCAKSQKFWFIGNHPPACTHGFQCDRQCIPYELVCNGKYDCLDGSDEHYDCVYSTSCDQLTTSIGHLSSAKITTSVENIHKNNLVHLVQKSVTLITVQINHTIWVAFYKFHTKENHFLKIYDGPYSTSSLLLFHSGSTKPNPVRSSSNDLYIEFPSYYDQSYGVDLVYTSVRDTGKPFVPGCGGYIQGDGIVSSPNYVSLTSAISECIWLVESGRRDEVLVLKKKFDRSNERNTTTNEFTTSAGNPIVTVYDGWNVSGQVLWNDNGFPVRPSRVYSISNKMMIQLNRPNEGENEKSFDWHVKTIPITTTYIDGLTAASGTIRSPNYPAPYPNSSDTRWNIVTAPHTKIVLLFALLETQQGFDFIYVYDGPTVNSPLLLEKSGSENLPFAVNSSTNQMLVRLTSDDEFTLTGFLAVYSTVLSI